MKYTLFCFSSKILRYPFIENVIGNLISLRGIFIGKTVNGYIGWGRRRTSLIPRYFAKKKKLPFIAIEDGYLRSFSQGYLNPPLSFVLDFYGIYYDSFCSSDLEFFLNSKHHFDANKQIAEIKKKILSHKLSKYNHAPDLNDGVLMFDEKPRVLVVDQTYGDMSVIYGGASEESFPEMLHAALIDHPTSTVYVKTHPEVTSGRKKGYLTHIQDSDRIVMIREDVNPIDLIQKMDKVYVVTSQMGFEALMCDKPVVCFGVSWYAGWGVTDDRVKDSPAWARRTKKRTVDELFVAAYLDYTRYLNPFTHERGTIFEVIEWLILQKKMVANQFKRAV